MNVANQSLSEQTLEATVARLVVEALRACGEDLTGCNLNRRGETKANSAANSSDALPDATGLPNAAILPEHVIEHQVISLKELENLPQRTNPIRVRANAVITPAAKDFLRQKGIEVVRGSDAASKATGTVQNLSGKTTTTTTTTTTKAFLVDSEKPVRAEAVARQLALRGLDVKVSNITDFASKLCGRESVGIFLSDLPVIEHDLLSRMHARRTAHADSVESVRRVSGRFAPECWVLDAHRLTLSGLVSVADACIRSHGIAQGPEGMGVTRK